MATSLGEGKLNSNLKNWPCIISCLCGEVSIYIFKYIMVDMGGPRHVHIGVCVSISTSWVCAVGVDAYVCLCIYIYKIMVGMGWGSYICPWRSQGVCVCGWSCWSKVLQGYLKIPKWSPLSLSPVDRSDPLRTCLFVFLCLVTPLSPG